MSYFRLFQEYPREVFPDINSKPHLHGCGCFLLMNLNVLVSNKKWNKKLC